MPNILLREDKICWNEFLRIVGRQVRHIEVLPFANLLCPVSKQWIFCVKLPLPTVMQSPP